MSKTHKTAKQLTLDNIPKASRKEVDKAARCRQEKQILINKIDATRMEDELALKVGFKLLPSKTSFSKVKSDLWFDNNKISSLSIKIPQGPLAANDFELTPVLDMKGITAGSHIIKIEMYELWSSGEKLSQASKEATVDYVPQTKEYRLVKIPIVKRLTGADLAVISDSEKGIYRDIEKTRKKELTAKRDGW